MQYTDWRQEMNKLGFVILLIEIASADSDNLIYPICITALGILMMRRSKKA